MKCAIIADTHGNLANIKKILDWLKKEKINFIIHCGDINGPVALKEGFGGFDGEIKVVLGNADFGQKEDYEILPNAQIFEKFGEINLAGKGVAFTHYPDSAKELAKSGKYDFVFYGHTHKPWEEKINKCRLVNPGEAAGQFQMPTFAVYDTEADKLELKILQLLN